MIYKGLLRATLFEKDRKDNMRLFIAMPFETADDEEMFELLKGVAVEMRIAIEARQRGQSPTPQLHDGSSYRFFVRSKEVTTRDRMSKKFLEPLGPEVASLQSAKRFGMEWALNIEVREVVRNDRITRVRTFDS